MAPEEGFEAALVDAKIREDHIAPTENDSTRSTVVDRRYQELSHAMLQAVLDGDHERARQLAEELKDLGSGAMALRLVK